jgi:hypothetical protein
MIVWGNDEEMGGIHVGHYEKAFGDDKGFLLGDANEEGLETRANVET